MHAIAILLGLAIVAVPVIWSRPKRKAWLYRIFNK